MTVTPSSTISAHVDRVWTDEILPALHDYIAIPNVSVLYDPQWREHGHMARAVELIRAWCAARNVVGLTVDVHELPGRTPLILMQIPAFGTGSADDTVLLYGHLDKQPEMTGWRDDLGPWKPVLEGDRLYGRGGADDGYAAFAAVLAIEAAQAAGISHTRCVVLIEGSEESGSPDLPAYLEALADEIGTPSLVLCLDSGCLDYERLWVTTSLRGLAAGTLRVEILTEGVHSGEASGVVPSSFRICRELLDRIEDSFDGRILLPELNVEIPADRRHQAVDTAADFPIGGHFPFVPGAEPMVADPAEQLLGPHLASGAQRHRGGRHPARRIGRQRAPPTHVVAPQRALATDVRPRGRAGCVACGPHERPAVRRTRDVRRRSQRPGMERSSVRPVVAGSTRRSIRDQLRQRLACLRRGWLDPVHGDARRDVPRCPVRDHRLPRARRQRSRAERVPPRADCTSRDQLSGDGARSPRISLRGRAPRTGTR